MVSLKEERELKKYEKDKASFESSKLITNRNKELVHKFVRVATQNRKNRAIMPYSYNSLRYTILKKICEDVFPNKDLDKLTIDDMYILAEDLETNKILNTNSNPSKPYQNSYKEQICKVINSFYEYHFGRDKEAYNNLMLNDYGKKILNIVAKKYQDKPILHYNDITRLIRESKKIEYGFYFGVLFDGGFRIEEFLNVRFKDIKELDGENQKYYVFNITEGTKTSKPRKVSLYSFPNTIRKYLDKRKKDNNYNENDYVFKFTPQYCNKVIKSELKRILGDEINGYNPKDFHNHSLRHSSATYYASLPKVTPTTIYSRYGWSFGSDEAREYIQMNQASNEREEESFREGNVYQETKEYKKELQELKKRDQKREEEIQSLKNQLLKIYDYWDTKREFEEGLAKEEYDDELAEKMEAYQNEGF